MYSYTARMGRPTSFLWAFGSQGLGWIVWLLATPWIVRLTRRFPVWPPRWKALGMHALTWTVVSVVFLEASRIASQIFPTSPMTSETASWFAKLVERIIGWSPSLVMAYGGLVGVGYALAYAEQVQREQREKAELSTQLVESQLGALRMQLQPHFLFNTLNSIAMLVRGADNERAVEMIALLGEVLRTLLRSSSDLEASVDGEMALLRRYLEIEEIRFGDRLRVRWEIDPDVECAQVPSLILQPVVENALRHGLWPRTEGGELVVTARRLDDEGDLELTVTDDGIGLSPEFSIDKTKGVGLSNVRMRLARMYGDAGKLDVVRRQPRGVAVRLRMPFHVEPQFDGGARG